MLNTCKTQSKGQRLGSCDTWEDDNIPTIKFSKFNLRNTSQNGMILNRNKINKPTQASQGKELKLIGFVQQMNSLAISIFH